MYIQCLSYIAPNAPKWYWLANGVSTAVLHSTSLMVTSKTFISKKFHKSVCVKLMTEKACRIRVVISPYPQQFEIHNSWTLRCLADSCSAAGVSLTTISTSYYVCACTVNILVAVQKNSPNATRDQEQFNSNNFENVYINQNHGQKCSTFNLKLRTQFLQCSTLKQQI